VRAHLAGTIAIDFLTVPTVTFNVLYVFFVLSLERRRLLHVNVTGHPHQTWTAQQVVEAVGFDTEIARLIRDRDRIYGSAFDSRVDHLGIRQLKIAPRSPWQNGHAERFVGTFRREVLDHVIIISDRHLLRLVRLQAAYYNEDRPHMSLDRDAPVSRAVEPPRAGRIVAFPASPAFIIAMRGSHEFLATTPPVDRELTEKPSTRIAQRGLRYQAACFLLDQRRSVSRPLAPPATDEPSPACLGVNHLGHKEGAVCHEGSPIRTSRVFPHPALTVVPRLDDRVRELRRSPGHSTRFAASAESQEREGSYLEETPREENGRVLVPIRMFAQEGTSRRCQGRKPPLPAGRPDQHLSAHQR
jgi:hypothetical protein